jgi:hypothetical protein
MTQESQLTLEQIQGRLNQREVPWQAALVRKGDPAVIFTPKDGSGISVNWDRGRKDAKSLDDIVEFLASYKFAG